MRQFTLHTGDCLDVVATLEENSVDAVVCDPPYGIGFMGKRWDHAENVAFRPETWASVLRVLKPGGHLVAFGAPKNYHRLACAIEDAGFEIRDSLMWVFGSGFPKSLDVSKAIDKALGVEGSYGAPKSAAHAGWIDRGRMRGEKGHEGFQRPWMQDEAAVDKAARQYEGGSRQARDWQGWGTALKPAYEPICLARKPLSEGTVAANVLRWGVGALNIDATRIATDPSVDDPRLGGKGSWSAGKMAKNGYEGGYAGKDVGSSLLGRWPANLAHDGSHEVLAGFPNSNGSGPARQLNRSAKPQQDGWGMNKNAADSSALRDAGSGSAARFFYCAKANKADRAGSKHPTVKPVALMRWLVRMVTPPGGTVLDPFAGTGTTGQAAIEEGFKAILIEREDEYRADIERRMAPLLPQPASDWLDSFMSDAEEYLDA